MKNKKQIIIIVFFVIILEVIFFRNVLFNDNLFGDDGDGRYISLMLEHYYNCFIGKESINILPVFYPMTNMLGSSDMLIGLAIPFVFFRFIGINLLLATKITIIIIHLLGTVSILYYFIKCLKLKLPASFLGTIIFSYSISLANSASHMQLYAICFIPLVLVMLYKFFDSKKKKYMYIALSIFALIFYTSFYTGYFYALGMILFGMLYILLEIKNQWNEKSNNNIRKILPVFSYLIYFIVIMLPFAYVYLSVYSQTGGFELIGDSSIYNMINVGRESLLYGKIMNISALDVPYGIPIIELVFFFICSIYLYNKEIIKEHKFIFYIPIVVLLFLILPINFGGFCLWNYVRIVLPGATAIRVLDRIYLCSIIPISIIVAYSFQLAYQQHGKVIKGILLFAIFLVLLENTTIYGVNSKWNCREYNDLFNQFSEPPKDVDAFFIVDNGQIKKYTDDKNYRYMLEAWMICLKYDIKTLNGYTGKIPVGWDLHHINSKAYLENVKFWIVRNNLEEKNIYTYDVSTNEWNVFKGVE